MESSAQSVPTASSRPIITQSHQGPILLIFLPTFLCPAALLVVATIIARLRNGAVISLEWTNVVLWDYTGLLTTLTITVAWTAVVILQTHVGLGDVDPPNSADILQEYERREYTSLMLYLLALISWKVSTGISNASLYGRAHLTRRRYSLIITGVIAAGLIAALLACAFQCSGPRYWAIRENQSACFDRPAFWIAVGAWDILSDLVIQGLLIFGIVTSHIAPKPKRTALAIEAVYLLTYIATCVLRLVFISRPWDSPDFSLIAAWAALATFSQLIFPMSVMCIGKMSRFLDMESYLSAAIGASSRKQTIGYNDSRFPPQPYGNNSSSASGPGKKGSTWRDSVEELPLRARGRSRERSTAAEDNSITITRDVDVQSERGIHSRDAVEQSVG